MKNSKVRNLTVTAVLAAVATVLMFLDFSVPVMPGFIKLDFSELPALIASFALGPLSGAAVCLIKNIVNALSSSTFGIGELSNFLLGCLFVVPAGLIYRKMQGRKGALVGALSGAALMALGSVITNYYIVYPAYTVFMPMDAILGMYRVINPNIENLWQALLLFNLPFTFFKGLCNTAITFLVYKKLSPILKGSAK